MKDWKTTVCAVATAALGFVAFSPEFFPVIVVAFAKYAALGGLAALGVAASDKK